MSNYIIVHRNLQQQLNRTGNSKEGTGLGSCEKQTQNMVGNRKPNSCRLQVVGLPYKDWCCILKR